MLSNSCGKVVWGRYLLPASQPSQKQRRVPVQRKRSAGPVKSTPVSLLARTNQDIWKILAETQTADNRAQGLSDAASRIEADLLAFGASFLDQIQSRTDSVSDMLVNLASASGDVNSARVLKIFPTFNNLYVCTVIGALPGAPRCQQNPLYGNSTLQARTGFGQNSAHLPLLRRMPGRLSRPVVIR